MQKTFNIYFNSKKKKKQMKYVQWLSMILKNYLNVNQSPLRMSRLIINWLRLTRQPQQYDALKEHFYYIMVFNPYYFGYWYYFW